VRVAPTYPPKTWRSKINPLPLALLSICRQIRHEATGVFYASVTIELATDWGISDIGADILRMITKLKLCNRYSRRVSFFKNDLTSLRKVCQALLWELSVLGTAELVEEIRADFGKPDLEVTFVLKEEDDE
jgi:hypothetical protein